ncbi:hypothetical protein LOTGIDRAFT_104270 [Lottia gigantea]|uniref:Transporter n=1 Tax=Lottia gigantea TaxID=225164 RepID=V4C8A0_LOTGI|nr:hypothetical protein LOTGIDRAFT_104270 [Lottia gigantea]ESO97939.1 hypothetical protein LOTGIDRAFT_104270 [Lottia gigantea]
MSQQQKGLLDKSRYNDIECDRNKIPHPETVERETWGKKIEFLLAIIGFAIDLGNVWRFPFICFKNGGGAFLIPYFIMLIFIGIPLFYMELALGQYHRSGPISIWLHICPIFCGIGYGICFIATFIGSYYNTVIAWAVYYLIASFTAEVPWKSCNNSWNTPNCVSLQTAENITNTSSSPAEEYFLREVLAMHKSTGINELGNIKWDLCLCLLAVFIIIYFCLWKGIKSSGKAVWVTAIAPFVILFALLIRGVTLPGAEIGLLYYIRPDFTRLLTVQVWLDAAAQVFFSLGPGFGTLIALSSYNKFDNNCYFDAIITSIINCFTSLLAGVAVFSVIGYMALKQGKAIEDVALKGPGLVFIVYPEALATIPWSSFWSILFFLMLLTLGLDSSFGGLESVITALSDAYPKLNKRRELLVLAVIVYCFVLGLPTTTYGGQYYMQIMDTHGAAISLLFICFCEIVALNWFYGVRRFSDDVQAMLGHRPGIFWKISWCFISPISLLLIFILSIVGYAGISLDDYTFPIWCQYVGWAITFASIVCVPIYMVYRVCITPGSIKTVRINFFLDNEPNILPYIYSTLQMESRQQHSNISIKQGCDGW